ncbi:putative phosphoinositide-binding protein [Trypanosoma grayi]|uniref:putative phosphoinositide-binding protein n=1 Tax=Trypanosoma grayi TaxID=71804 RepID=UPI0004F46FE9|nr:putative phosphoinositide-binding protein [Trypanosoma grayi]KEG10702.1 putative phosphoinositide-binding protein [Trypanosoma grayi]
MGESVFEFHVLEPEQRKGAGALDLAYWTYGIRTTTSLPTYPNNMSVVRRYSDFEWFRARLCEEYPYCIVPPIPEKDVQGTLEKIVGSSTQAAARLHEYRQRALQRFLTRLGAHPKIYTSQLLENFLQMDETEWERKIKAPIKTSDRSFATTLGEGVNYALTRQWNPSGGAAAASASGSGYSEALGSEETNSLVWQETQLYIQQLEDSIKMLRERVQMLVERRRNTSQALHEFGIAFEKVGEVEKGISATQLSNALIAVGQQSEQLSTIYIEHAGDETRKVVETLSYYTGMCAAVRETLKRLQHATHRVESLNQHAADIAAQRDKAMLRGGMAERVAKLENDYNALQGQKELAKKELETGESTFREELRRFHREKQYDVKAILKTFAELQLNYAMRMKESWEKLLPVVEHVQLNEGRSLQDSSSRQA